MSASQPKAKEISISPRRRQRREQTAPDNVFTGLVKIRPLDEACRFALLMHSPPVIPNIKQYVFWADASIYRRCGAAAVVYKNVSRYGEWAGEGVLFPVQYCQHGSSRDTGYPTRPGNSHHARQRESSVDVPERTRGQDSRQTRTCRAEYLFSQTPLVPSNESEKSVFSPTIPDTGSRCRRSSRIRISYNICVHLWNCTQCPDTKEYWRMSWLIK